MLDEVNIYAAQRLDFGFNLEMPILLFQFVFLAYLICLVGFVLFVII